MWLCPAHAIKERDICTPSDVNRCSIDVYKVNDTFVELFDWADGHMVATNVKVSTANEKVRVAGLMHSILLRNSTLCCSVESNGSVLRSTLPWLACKSC